MKNKELIDKWESKTGAPSYEISDFPINPSKNEMYIAGYGVARAEIIEDLKQLDEPQKKIIPKCADEFIQEGIGLGSSCFEIITSADSFANAKPQEKFSKWLNNNPDLFIRAVLDGYEVEKEPLYCVIINGRYLVKVFSNTNVVILVPADEISQYVTQKFQLTEKQIKAIDERYWAFAVPVEEVVEG